MLRTPALLALVCLPGVVSAANTFRLEDASGCTGQGGIPIYLRAELDQPAYAFSFGIKFDPTRLQVTGVSLEGTSIPLSAPEFFDGRIDPALGVVGYGCVLDFGPTFEDALPPGPERPIARLTVDLLGIAGTTPLSLETVASNPDPNRKVPNVLTTASGTTIKPSLLPGSVEISGTACGPAITAITGGSGGVGTVFQIEGTGFGEPGLAVTVCGSPAAATLRGDGITLDVTAPACGSTGPAPVQVCTARGCSDDPDGFNYLPTASDRHTPNDENEDGRFDLSDPVSILNHLFLGTNPTLPCGDGTTADPGNIALFDSNGDGRIDLSDPVHMLSFLFLGGALPATCGNDLACPCVIVAGCASPACGG